MFCSKLCANLVYNWVNSIKTTRNSTKGVIEKPPKRSGKHLEKCQTSSAKRSKIDFDGAHDGVITSSDVCANTTLPQNRLSTKFFDAPCTELAKRLLGKILVRKHADGTLMKGRIVETESYPGDDDKASASYGGKVTPKNKSLFKEPGTAYVYMTYGMYYCINICSRGDGAAVLLRALEPIEGIDNILKNRQSFGKNANSDKPKQFKTTELCNGPSKLCIGFSIKKDSVNEKDICTWDEMWLENDDSNPIDIEEDHIVKTKRIGIDSVGEPWASKPLRFYIYNSLFVSRYDKKSEEIIKQNVLKSNKI